MAVCGHPVRRVCRAMHRRGQLVPRWCVVDWPGVHAAHPTYGKLDYPSDQAIDAAMVTLLGTPVAAVAGAFAGVGLAEWLARR